MHTILAILREQCVQVTHNNSLFFFVCPAFVCVCVLGGGGSVGGWVSVT